MRRIVLSWWEALPHTVLTDDANTVEVKSGSQTKMRLLGGAFVAASSLPMRTKVTMSAKGGRTEVAVTATDAAGFGIKAGMRGKYERRAADIVEKLRGAVESAR